MNQPIYLLDANVLINAHNLYYSVDMVPEFWAWLHHMAQNEKIKMPIETFEEVAGGADAKKDLLNDWLKSKGVKDALILAEEVDTALLADVMNVYAPDLNDYEIEQVGRDPFLITYVLSGRGTRCVVSDEVSKPSKQRANQKVPDICRKVGAPCCNTFAMLRQLGFKTGWAA